MRTDNRWPVCGSPLPYPLSQYAVHAVQCVPHPVRDLSIHQGERCARLAACLARGSLLQDTCRVQRLAGCQAGRIACKADKEVRSVAAASPCWLPGRARSLQSWQS